MEGLLVVGKNVPWLQVPRVEPHIMLSAQQGICFSLSLCHLCSLACSLILSLSQMNKLNLKKQTNKKGVSLELLPKADISFEF